MKHDELWRNKRTASIGPINRVAIEISVRLIIDDRKEHKCQYTIRLTIFCLVIHTILQNPTFLGNFCSLDSQALRRRTYLGQKEVFA